MIDTFGLRRGVGTFTAALARILETAAVSLDVENAADIERAAKAVSALIGARRALMELQDSASADASEQDEEDNRAELRRRVARFVEADLSGAPAEVLERIAVGGAPR